MKCPKCNASDHEVGAKFCHVCGTRLINDNRPYGGGAPLDPIINIINNMVDVNGGIFNMGATAEQGNNVYNNERPIHEVTLSSFSIGRYEVTQEEWEAVMDINRSIFKGAKQPVQMVSWDDCQEFIRKLNAMTNMSFRLPTEAEWEFAARGGNKSRGFKYSGSDNLDDVAWFKENSRDKGEQSPDYGTHSVGQKRPNELGLYDMCGNVWEWCSDWFGDYSPSPQTNPQGPSSGSLRVFRGGSWFLAPLHCRLSGRFYSTPDYRNSDLGLRLAL